MNYRIFFYFFSLMLFPSCKMEKSKEMTNDLIGEWHVYSSEMNHKPNKFMEDAYFMFTADNSVISNIFNDNKSHDFSVADERLLIDTEDKFDLKISRLSNDTLILEGKMKVFYMKFYLRKIK